MFKKNLKLKQKIWKKRLILQKNKDKWEWRKKLNVKQRRCFKNSSTF